MKKRALSILLMFVTTISFLTILDDEKVCAYTNHTQAEAVAWARNMADTHTYCGECVALIQKYYAWLGVSVPNTNANTYANADHIPSGWTVNNTPSIGAVYVEANDSPGHVSIVVGIDSAGTLTTVDSNVIGSSYGQYNAQYFPWNTGRKKSDYAGVAGKYFVHPDFKQPTPTVPTGKEMTKGYDRVIPDGDYIIAKARNTDSKNNTFFFMDIQGTDKVAKNSTNVQLWNRPADETPDCDVWTLKYSNGYYSIKQKGTNMSLDVAGGKYERGTNVQVYQSLNNDSQKWAISEVWNGGVCVGYRIQSKRNSYYVDVHDNGTAKGTNIKLYSKNADSGAAQQWEFIPYKPAQPVSNGRYILVSSLDPTLTLDVAGNTASVANNTNVQVWHDNTDSKYNSFDVKKLSNGYYAFTHAASGKSLDLRGGFSNACTNANANVEVYAAHGGLNQQWAVIKQNDGYMIVPRCSGFAVDVENGKTSNGTNVRQARYNGSKAQTWKFVPAEYTVSYNANGGTSAPVSQVKYYKANLNLSNSRPVRNGFTFKGWSTSSSSTTAQYQPSSSYTNDANITLYAVWEKNATPASPTPSSNINKPSPVSEKTISKVKVDKKIAKIAASKIKTIGSSSKKQMTIEIPKVAGATNYLVAYKTVTAKNWKYYYTGGKNKYVIKGLKLNTLLQFKVSAYKGGARGDWSNVSYRYMMTAKSTKAKVGKKSITVTWKKDAKATGYQVLYSTNKNMKGYKTITLKGASKTKRVIKNLKKGKTYYVRVRTLKKYKGKTYVGILAPIRTVKVK